MKLNISKNFICIRMYKFLRSFDFYRVLCIIQYNLKNTHNLLKNRITVKTFITQI